MSDAASDQATASPEHGPQGGAAQLVRMANDIGNFFRAEPNHEEAVIGVSNHIAKYWTQRMRDKLAAYLKNGAQGLDELPREAFARVSQKL
jgi:formate dehydrogenase subunit delta